MDSSETLKIGSLEKITGSAYTIDKLPPTTLLKGKKLAIVFMSFIAAFFPVAVDQTIISTALPTIASQFQAVSDLSWIAGAYFLPLASFMLFFGQLLTISAAKPILLGSIAIFELGSLFCGIARSVNFIIFGRAVSGAGAAGIWISIMSIIAQITTVTQRPFLLGIFGAVFAVSSITGPLLGGVFADKVTWRWCFYINLPIGAFAILTLIIFLPYMPVLPANNHKSLLHRVLHLDWVGTFLSIAMSVMLLLPLQWGGNNKAWNDPAVISTLVLFFVFLILLLLWEYRQKDVAVLPLRLFLNPSMLGACIEGFLIYLGFILGNYYLPFFYQIRGHSATRSGIDILPLMASGVIATLASGAIIAIYARPWPFLFAGPLIATAGFALMFTVNNGTSSASIAGYQILVGVGLGVVMQTLLVIVQGVFIDQPHLIPQATSVLTYTQLVGSSVGLAAAEAVFSSQLHSQINKIAAGIPPEAKAAVLESIKAAFALPEEQKQQILQAYSIAISRVFLIGVPASALGSVAVWLIVRDPIVVNQHDAVNEPIAITL